MATRSNFPFDESLLANHEATPEKAPSVMVQDRHSSAQIAAFLGLFLVIVGSLSQFLPRASTAISPGWAFALTTLGVALMLYHCFADPEYQFRRLYGVLAILMGIAGCGACLIPASSTSFGPYWLMFGVPLLALSPLFAIGVLRHEDEPWWRGLMQNYLGVMFVLLVGGGLFGLVRGTQFVASGGVAFFLVSVAFAAGYIGTQPPDSDRAFRAGLGLGVIGAGMIVGGVIASFMIEQFLVPNGLMLIGVGLLMGMVSLGTCSDAPYVVLTRRELAAYFYSPIAYFVMVAMLAVFALSFWVWSERLERLSRGEGVIEPIVRDYLTSIIPIITMMVFIPIVTMRLFSEEMRSGSLEVLLTAPLREGTIVLAKFTAALLFSLIVWLPAFLFLIGLRVVNQVEFDYRPILSFALVLIATNVNFIGMGLFCSSLTTNQIVAAILAFTGMVIQTLFAFHPIFTHGTALQELLQYLSYLELWNESLLGNVAPRQLLLHVSIGSLFVFLTILVLNARKWK